MTDCGNPAENKGLTDRQQMALVRKDFKKPELDKILKMHKVSGKAVSLSSAIAILGDVGIDRINQLRGNGIKLEFILRRLKIDQGSFTAWLSANDEIRQKYLTSFEIDLLGEAHKVRKEVLTMPSNASFQRVNATRLKSEISNKIIDGSKPTIKDKGGSGVLVEINLFGSEASGVVVSEQ